VNTYLNQAEENTMNKKLISMAVGAALAAGTVVAQAADDDMMPKVYGKLHVSYGALKDESTDAAGVKTTNTDNIQLNSHASRLGVKGSVPISDTLKGTYQLEYEVNPDSDNAKSVSFPDGAGGTITLSDGGTAGLKRRNQWVGLKGGFGEVRFGRNDTPTKSYQGKFDEFNDTFGDFANIVLGDKRLDNTITYLSPDFTGFTFSAQIAPGEGNGCDGTEVGGCKVGGSNGGDGPADIISLAGGYKMAGLFVSLGYDSYDSKSADYESLMRLVATYGTKMFQVGGFYEDNKGNTIGSNDLANDKTAYGISGHVTFADVHKIKLQYVTGTTDANKGETGDFEEVQTSLGYDFKMGKSTTAYALYTMYEGKDKSKGDSKDEASFIGVGMIQNF
jgi:predicted porin